MTTKNFLAFDFGATSGRAIVGSIDKRIELNEAHRFSNPHTSLGGQYYWDALHLYRCMIDGLKKAVASGCDSLSGIAVDTWGVDFGLLDASGRLVSNPVMYRDPRTQGMMEKVFKKVSRDVIYGETGIQFMELNTLFQWASLIEENNPQLDVVDTLLFMPNLLTYFLTGEKSWEYTMCSTSQLLNAEQKDWSDPVFKALDLNRSWVGPISEPGTEAGFLIKTISDEVRLSNVPVLLTASHDTASAVAAVPAEGDDWAYLSSGTWSLIGIETKKPIISELSSKYNYTNEGGVDGTIRFLKNVAGMWLLEECRRVWSLEESVPYEDLIAQAEASKPFLCLIDPDHAMFGLPENMPLAIRQFCQKTDQPVPETKGAIVRCIFESLALKYAMVLEQIEEMTGKNLNRLHIIGGGSQNQLLNQWTANATGLQVLAGPTEATAIGNILVQAVGTGLFHSIREGRAMVGDSFPVKRFQPENHNNWKDQNDRFLRILNHSA